MLRRFRIYKQNMRVAKFWQKNDQGGAEYGETPFSDMTQEEFRKVQLYRFNHYRLLYVD